MKKIKLYMLLVLTILLCSMISISASAAKKPGKVKNVQLKNSGTSKHILTWDEVTGADGYKVYCKDCSAEIQKFVKVKTIKKGTTLTYTVKKRVPGITYEYIIRAFKIKKGKTYYGKYSVAIAGTIPKAEETKQVQTANGTIIVNPKKSQKFKLVFGDSKLKDTLRYPGSFYKSSADAKANMTEITVKTWDFKKGKSGEKITRTWKLTVNKNLAATVTQIFKEIYEGKEQFPIHELGGFRWDGSHSEHNTGTAIDINWTENYMVNTSTGVISCGKYWKPGVDPYSIPKTGELATIFKKYGFTQGEWGASKDYMHFSYFGT